MLQGECNLSPGVMMKVIAIIKPISLFLPHLSTHVIVLYIQLVEISVKLAQLGKSSSHGM